MTSILRFSVATMAIVAGLAIGAPSPALAARQDCASNANLVHVRRRLDGAIDRLGHDRHDYGGHRVAAIGDLQNARAALMAAASYAITVRHESPSCMYPRGTTGGSDRRFGIRNQGPSNRDVWIVRAWVERMIAQLNGDQRDYGGHRAAALADMQAARAQLVQAERYARSHGH